MKQDKYPFSITQRIKDLQKRKKEMNQGLDIKKALKSHKDKQQ